MEIPEALDETALLAAGVTAATWAWKKMQEKHEEIDPVLEKEEAEAAGKDPSKVDSSKGGAPKEVVPRWAVACVGVPLAIFAVGVGAWETLTDEQKAQLSYSCGLKVKDGRKAVVSVVKEFWTKTGLVSGHDFFIHASHLSVALGFTSVSLCWSALSEMNENTVRRAELEHRLELWTMKYLYRTAYADPGLRQDRSDEDIEMQSIAELRSIEDAIATLILELRSTKLKAGIAIGVGAVAVGLAAAGAYAHGGSASELVEHLGLNGETMAMCGLVAGAAMGTYAIYRGFQIRQWAQNEIDHLTDLKNRIEVYIEAHKLGDKGLAKMTEQSLWFKQWSEQRVGEDIKMQQERVRAMKMERDAALERVNAKEARVASRAARKAELVEKLKADPTWVQQYLVEDAKINAEAAEDDEDDEAPVAAAKIDGSADKKVSGERLRC